MTQPKMNQVKFHRASRKVSVGKGTLQLDYAGKNWLQFNDLVSTVDTPIIISSSINKYDR